MIQTLEKYFAFYNKLSPEKKEAFVTRAENFIAEKTFVPKGELTAITYEMQVLVAANAVQLTFGLKEILFDHFEIVLIYPEEFYSNFSEAYQRGEAHPDGVLVFSWKHLALGNLIPEQSENIGLRVFAKALGVQNNTEGPEYDILQNYRLREWKDLADKEFEKARYSGKELFKKSPIAAREDFFPVCVECFFEQPELFKKESLNLYNALASLLNQFP